jgi:hypothetical protein
MLINGLGKVLKQALTSNSVNMEYHRFDALLEGEWDVIPDDNLPPEFQHRGEYERWRSFKPRAPETAFQARRSVQERFARVADHVEFHFISIRGGTDSGVVSDYAAYARGIMFGIGHYPSRATAVISISYELFEPLLRTDLTAAERAVQTFIFALTLFHETCVSVGLACTSSCLKIHP